MGGTLAISPNENRVAEIVKKSQKRPRKSTDKIEDDEAQKRRALLDISIQEKTESWKVQKLKRKKLESEGFRLTDSENEF